MTDLEMTKLCAEAMGLREEIDDGGNYYDAEGSARSYWPINNDAQAMALVKKFGLKLYPNDNAKGWTVLSRTGLDTFAPDLNRAIVECVAKMQAVKAAQP